MLLHILRNSSLESLGNNRLDSKFWVSTFILLLFHLFPHEWLQDNSTFLYTCNIHNFMILITRQTIDNTTKSLEIKLEKNLSHPIRTEI